MKKFLITLLIPFSLSAQPDTCFTEQEIQDISFTLDSLYALDSINKEIIAKQHELAAQLRDVIKLDSMEISYRIKQTELLKTNIDLYVEREKRLKPRWYDNKAIWFGTGILTSILIFETVK
jgi:hypothetical protein